jgi:acetyltransferase-like isoleucine patch superfamily enzyme
MLRADPRGPGLFLGAGVVVGTDVLFGAHVTVHDGTVIGTGCVIEDGVVLGKRPRLARNSSSQRGRLSALEIGERVTVCAGAVVFAGSRIADGAIVGDQANVRERVQVGADTVIGRGSSVENDVTIGERVRIQSNAYITARCTIEDDVFVGPCAMTTNDNTMSRHPPGHPLDGAILRRACRIGGGAVLVPGVEVGEEAFVAAGAVVTRDVAPRAVMVGVPARHLRDVGDEDLLERWQ